MSISDILSAIGLLFSFITGKKNKPQIVVKIRPINVVDDNSWELDVNQTMETGNIERVYVPRRMDIEITVINKGSGSIYVEEVRFIMNSSYPADFSPSFSYPLEHFGYPETLEVKERTKVVFRIDRELLKEEALKNDLGREIRQVWIKDATDNYTKLKIPVGMKHIFVFSD